MESSTSAIADSGSVELISGAGIVSSGALTVSTGASLLEILLCYRDQVLAALEVL